MKALILNGAKDFCYEERKLPVCQPEDVVVKVDAVSICGSDIHAIGGNQPLFSFPRVIGHEVAGTVYQTGEEVKGLSVGDKVCLMPCIPCGGCRTCKKGKTNTCKDLKLYGVHVDGGLQEFLTAPEENWLKIPWDARPEEIAILEPLTIGAHAVEKLSLSPGDRVLVIGSGPIGVSCALNARTYGAEVTLSDTNPARRSFASRRFNLEILDPLMYNVSQEIERITDGEWFDAVIDTTASKASMEQAWKWICHGGKIVFVGICRGTLELDGISFHMKEPSLYVTRNSTRRDYERVLHFWRLGLLEPAQFITHTVPFGEAGKALIRWSDPASEVFKGVVKFSNESI